MYGMRRSCYFFILLMLMACGAGYHRVKYSEMPAPPEVTLKNNELIVTTRNLDKDGLSVYKIDIDINDRTKVIELRGYQAIGKPEKTEFKITLTETQLIQIKNYRVYWMNPGNKKNRVTLENKL